ncbi:MAG: hypothetical protein F6K40_38580 [Okeania sp. SIO3I5]|uniref:hypothetical protein n=1 Tax=Okeania sp. SIO3I5 TaxID=2607805 RepID=UPI0013BC8D81|nr:hypothetical protein [Okeania sp. SIO3I5]NEQ41773.1 hypothetical protein [Okeania sp. SIO3I5]
MSQSWQNDGNFSSGEFFYERGVIFCFPTQKKLVELENYHLVPSSNKMDKFRKSPWRIFLTWCLNLGKMMGIFLGRVIN